MKKTLIILLNCSATIALATGFQDFNNNAYLQYSSTYMNEGASGNSNGYTLGATYQSKANIWINAEAYGSAYNSNSWQVLATTNPPSSLGGSTYGFFLATAKAGYAFQFFNNDANGFQVIPYITGSYGTALGALTDNYGAGAKPEYRFGKSLKVSLDAMAYSTTQNGGGAVPAAVNPSFSNNYDLGTVQDFRYTLNPEVQYDISQIVLLGIGYKYDQSFNNQPNGNPDGNSTVYARIGVLF
ncbi:MAG: hypothetical protein QG673_2335 [Pseudomonadota bacterium]|nr:hypothetical protein [Pseudomonadota bacterium]